MPLQRNTNCMWFMIQPNRLVQNILAKKREVWPMCPPLVFMEQKNLTTGEGGALVTNDDALADKIKVLREKGTDKHSVMTDNKTRGYYEYVDVGMSYVQSNINGALGISQLRRLDEMNNTRKRIAERYTNALEHIEGLDFLRITKGSEHNWHLFGILVPEGEKFWVMDAPCTLR